MSESAEISFWKSLKPPPNDCSHMNIHQLNTTELLIVPNITSATCLLKYNLISDEWQKWHQFPEDMHVEFPHQQCMRINLMKCMN